MGDEDLSDVDQRLASAPDGVEADVRIVPGVGKVEASRIAYKGDRLPHPKPSKHLLLYVSGQFTSWAGSAVA